MFSATNSNGVPSRAGVQSMADTDGGMESSSRRMSVAQAAELLAQKCTWRVRPTLDQLALYQREDGAYFCAVEGCAVEGLPERGKDAMATMGPLVFCHAHGKEVLGMLRREHCAGVACKWHYLSRTVHFAGQANAHAAAPVSEPERTKPRPPRFASADEVAEAILGGQRVERASKRPRPDGSGQEETQCVVAVNAPHLCDRWGNWEKMPTASGSSRAHYGFCPQCAQVCADSALTLGPPLRAMIMGRRPAVKAPRQERPPRVNGMSGSHPVAVSRIAGCNMALGVLGNPIGNPSDGLDQIPVFHAEDFADHYACDAALDETAEAWWLRLRNHHTLPGVSDAAFRRNRAALMQATDKAKTCPFHGPVVCMLAEFRNAVKAYYKEQWPREWAERVAFAKGRQGNAQKHKLRSCPICEYCKTAPGIQVYDGMPACKGCKNQRTRSKRESAASARAEKDRQYGENTKGHNPSPPNSFKKKGTGKK